MIYLFATRQKVACFRSGVHLARSFDWSGVARELAPAGVRSGPNIFTTAAQPSGSKLPCQRLDAVSALYSADRQPAPRCFLIFVMHVGTGIAHGADHP
ncbi:hypothetical protein C4E44_30595, partial [Pseudomonas sp. MWU12-2312b]